MKKILFAVLMVPALALAQTFPSPTFNALTLQTPLSAANGGTGATAATGSGSVVLATSPTIASPSVTGAFTATGLVTTADLATQAANTVLANGTGSSASPTAFAMPSCSTSASALNWTAGAGFICNTAVLASNVSGTVAIANGGTGQTTQAAALTALLGSSTVPVANGGTNATTATAATSNLQYLQGGTGSVARSLTSRFQDVISVRDFGALGDGAHDDTAAIQAAITYVLSLANGGAVYLPQGTYKVTAQINIPNTANISFRLYGAGAATKIKYTGSATVNIFSAGSGTPTFGSLYQFDDFGFLGPTGGVVTAFNLNNINNSLFYNVSVFGNTNGIILQSSFNTRIIDCYFNTQSQYGISTNVTGTNALYIAQTGISNAGTAAINLAVGGNNIVIRDNDLEANAVALELTNYTSVLFEGNYVENGANSSLSFSGTNNAIDIRQNWLGANTTSTTIGNVTGGSFVNNTIFNSGWTFSNVFDMDSGGNLLTGTATLASTPFQTSISLVNTWTAGSHTPGYKKSTNGIVEIRGNIVAGSSSYGNAVFVLPVGYRPSQQKIFAIFDSSSVKLGQCIVDTNGNVVPNVSTGSVGDAINLDGIMFNAAN